MFKILTNKQIISIIATYLFVGIALFVSIPKITEKTTIETITKNSLNNVEQIKLTRAYYLDSIVKDVKEFAPKLSFSYDHNGVNGKLPLPTTIIHDLSKIFSDNTGVQFKLYSEFPFQNRADRVLSKEEKEALKFSKQNPEGIYVKREKIEGKEYLRVAVTDYMTSGSCVKCHNSHPDKTWESDKWKIGDKRGVIEVITPIDKELRSNGVMLKKILALITFATVFMLLINGFLIIKEKKK